MLRPGFLHTSHAHVATFDALLAELLPDVEPVHRVDESLLSRARVQGPEAVRDDVRRRLQQVADDGAASICCTCSSVGAVAEERGIELGIPVFRVDRPMARLAVASGRRVGVVATVASTIAPTEDLLGQAAAEVGRAVDLTSVVADEAWPHFEAGDLPGYLAVVADAVRELAPRVDVVVLAQASMAGAEALLTDLLVPVLSSPRPAAVELARRCS